MERGVWEDFPARSKVISKLTPQDAQQLMSLISGSVATDVTGGMQDKVEQSLALCEALPGMEILIFSGDEPGELLQVLHGSSSGTLITCSTE